VNPNRIKRAGGREKEKRVTFTGLKKTRVEDKRWQKKLRDEEMP
jgi:hypothetical protein